METVVNPVKKIAAQVSVPGGAGASRARALVLAALSEGKSTVRHVPVAADRVVSLLRELGVDITKRAGTHVVRGVGLRGFREAEGPLNLEGLGDTALLLIPLLAGQTFRSQVKLGAEAERCRPLLNLLAQLGFAVEQESADTFVTGGQQAKGFVLSEAPPTDALALGATVAALFAEGTTALKVGSRVERLLRGRGIAVERRKLLSVEGGQVLQGVDVEVPGQLALAYPLIGAALCRKGSELTIKRVVVRPGQRAFLDLLRQIGAQIDAEGLEGKRVRFARECQPVKGHARGWAAGGQGCRPDRVTSSLGDPGAGDDGYPRHRRRAARGAFVRRTALARCADWPVPRGARHQRRLPAPGRPTRRQGRS